VLISEPSATLPESNAMDGLTRDPRPFALLCFAMPDGQDDEKFVRDEWRNGVFNRTWGPLAMGRSSG
jgi:hypothetical protein